MESIIKACKICYLALCNEGKPYVIPMNFALHGDNVILHSGKHGRLWDTIQNNKEVCINWTLGDGIKWQDVHVGCSYSVESRSVNVEGVLEVVDDYDEKYTLLKIFMSQYSDKEFKFSAPAVKNVVVYKVPIRQMTGRMFGVRPPYKTDMKGEKV